MIINESKLARQIIGANKWVTNKGKGTLEYCTGFGKTFTAFILIKKMLEKDDSRTTVIVVPTIQLKQQWEAKIEKDKVKNIRVYVINTIVLNELKLDCNLLILDELHRFASTEFKKVFDLIKYSFILGLTATVNRLDGKHDLLIEKSPVIDTITIEEALREGWISEFFEYNLGIELSEQDRIDYDSLNKNFHKYFSFFGHDFNLAMNCCKKLGAEAYANQHGLDSKLVAFRANSFNRYMRLRKTFLYKAECKLLTTLQVIERFPYKTVTFSESTEFADKLTECLGDIAICYHSNLTTQIRTINGKEKKFGKTKLQTEALKKFADNRYKIRVLNTAKALDQGYDQDDVVVGVVTSSTTNPTQHKQRNGRIFRDYTYKSGVKKGQRKIALIINIYIKDTQDEKWLIARQTDAKTKRPINPNVVYITNLNEISYGIQLDVSESANLSATTE
jgi:superfamily II DNA or RNA helicase